MLSGYLPSTPSLPAFEHSGTCLARPRPTLGLLSWCSDLCQGLYLPPTSGIVYRPWNEILVRAQILGSTARPLAGSTPSFGSRHESDSFCYRNWTENMEKNIGKVISFTTIHSLAALLTCSLLLVLSVRSLLHTDVHIHTHTPGAVKLLSLKIGLADSACWGHLHCKLKIGFSGWG